MNTLLEKDIPFHFSPECHSAFQTLKKALTTTPIIQSPNSNEPFEIMCDVSDFAIGAVLGQMMDKKQCVIYYASKTLSGAQRNYSTTEKEFLAVMYSLEKFRSYLIVSYVIIYSDHACHSPSSC